MFIQTAYFLLFLALDPLFLSTAPLLFFSPLIDTDIKSIISPFFCPFVGLWLLAQVTLTEPGEPKKTAGESVVTKRKSKESERNGRK